MHRSIYRPSDICQAEPREICRIPWGPCCSSWTCSIECRAKKAWREAGITAQHLLFHEQRQVLAITLVVKENLLAADHKSILKRLKWRFKSHLPDAGYELVADFSDSGRLHWHGFAVGATIAQVREAWRLACGDRAVQTDVRPIGTTIERAVKYAFKVRGDSRGEPLRLAAKGLHVTPTHRFFLGKSKAELWVDFKSRYFAERPEIPQTKGNKNIITFDKDWDSEHAWELIEAMPPATRKVYSYLDSTGDEGATGPELAEATGEPLGALSPLILDLAAAGWIEATGEQRDASVVWSCSVLS